MLFALTSRLHADRIGPVVNFVRTEKGQALESMSTDASDHVQLNFAGGNRRDFGVGA